MTADWIKRRRIAEHEACHAVVAMRMGLPVSWVSIDQGTDEGITFTAAVKIPDEQIDRERDCFAICVAMSAPAHLITHHADENMRRYSLMEAGLAYEIAGRNGIEFDDVYDKAVDLVDEHWVEICDLAERLVEEGKVVFQTV